MRDPFASLRSAGRSGRRFDWEVIHNSAGLQGIVDLLTAGCYVGLSSTSDGGAAGITVMFGDSKIKEYWVDLDSDDIVEWLGDVLAAVQAPPPPPTGSRARRRGPAPVVQPPAEKGPVTS